MTRTLADSLAWAGDGAAHLRGLMTRMGDEAFRAPSALPGWTRAHVLTHIARNADGMVNLLEWARTGVETPAYASREQRDADIEAGAGRDPEEVRRDVVDTSDRLARVAKAMPEAAWAAVVRNVQGRPIPATDVVWIRAREMWIHAVDLDVGGSFDDLPAPMVAELLADVTAMFAARDDVPPLRIAPRDADRTWSTGEGPDLVEVRGPAAAAVSWLLGRGRAKELRTADGRPPPTLPSWL